MRNVILGLVIVLLCACAGTFDSPTGSDIQGGQSDAPPAGLYCMCIRDTRNMDLLICREAVATTKEYGMTFRYDRYCKNNVPPFKK